MQSTHLHLAHPRAMHQHQVSPTAILRVISADRASFSTLYELGRAPPQEQLYRRFKSLIAQRHASMTAYMLTKLAWIPSDLAVLDGGRQFWQRNDSTRVLINDWPYSVPSDVW